MDQNDDKRSLNKQHVQRRFDKVAARFDEADFVHAATRGSLLERLQPVVVDAAIVVDLGSATGGASKSLGKRFRGARIVSVDLSRNMLLSARRRCGWLSRTTAVQADASSLPFGDGSVDVVFANMLLPWIGDLHTVLAEVSRVLRKGGLFAFATLGPDSLRQLREAWQQVDDDDSHVRRFPDMHDLGDALVRAGFSDPVLDVDRLSVSYTSPDDLFRDLTLAGARNSLGTRRRGLAGRRSVERLRDALESARSNSKILIDLELIFGHCWGSGARPGDDGFRIDAGRIPVRRR